jgi:hypothetical protein
VVRQGDAVQASLISPAQDIQDADIWLLIVNGGRGVDVKIDTAPLEVIRIW